MEQLVLVAWGAAVTPHGAATMDLVQKELQRRLPGQDSENWRQNVLGILHASSFGGCTSQRCVLQVARSLQRLGRRLDGGQLGAVGGAGAMVEMDLVDRMVLLKPVDWEVSDENMELQVVDFLRDSGSSMPILEDKEFGQGLLHRLDVPSSGLLLMAKTYEAHCDLSVQLAAGHLERDYSVLAHGWAVDRKISAQLYWRRAPVTKAGGRGKPSLTQVKVSKYFLALSSAVTLLAIRIFTGRQHQIRAHLAHVGHPVLTDGKYSSGASYGSDVRLSSHNALHRERLAFRDLQGQRREVTAEFSPHFGCSISASG